MELITGNIIKVNGTLGKAIKHNDGYRFLPVNYGRYYTDNLDVISNYEETTHDEKVELLKQEFVWGKVLKVHSVSDFVIFEYEDKHDRSISFHGYTNYRDRNTSWESLDQAIVGLIANKYDGANSQAAQFFFKMVSM